MQKIIIFPNPSGANEKRSPTSRFADLSLQIRSFLESGKLRDFRKTVPAGVFTGAFCNLL
ncbi:hypothetical protein CH378_10165 [Leptospira kmetyi]|uniref:Diacylglycerol kinase n=1 Tax=Leptospira kmetyi TaxID=408139 RepID=A0ABX4N9J8_9LEPT|nr:hypothetical protein CH378_10165 [Leptospira kmetyi]